MPSFSGNPYTVIVGALLVVPLGMTALARMPVDVFPRLHIKAAVEPPSTPGVQKQKTRGLNMLSAASGLLAASAALFALSLALGGCSSLGMGAPTPAERAQYLEPMLSAAGFHMLAASTPEKMQHLKKLPPLKVNYYEGKKGELHYWFADPDYCHCLYTGNEQAYQKYEQLRLQARMARQEREAEEENYEASQEMQMNMMDPFFGGFGFGPGIGFAY